MIELIRALKGLSCVDSCCSKSKFYRKDLIEELEICVMSPQYHLNDFTRDRIIKKIEKRRKITDASRDFDIAHSVVSRLWKSFRTTGMCSKRHGRGRVRSKVRCLQKISALSCWQKGTDTLQFSRWQISFLLPQDIRSSEKL